MLSWAQDQTARFAPSTAAVIDWQNVIIGGHSRGGAVAARSAAAYPAFGPSAPLPTAPPAHLPGSCIGRCSADRPVVAAVLLVDPVAQAPVRVPLVSPREPHFAVGALPRLYPPPPSPPRARRAYHTRLAYAVSLRETGPAPLQHACTPCQPAAS